MNTRKPLSCISTKRLARKRLAIALSLVFSGLGTLALSQTAAAADDYQTIDGVGVTAQALKIDVSLQDTPQSVNIVTREHLDNTVATKIDDSLPIRQAFGIRSARTLIPIGSPFEVLIRLCSLMASASTKTAILQRLLNPSLWNLLKLFRDHRLRYMAIRSLAASSTW